MKSFIMKLNCLYIAGALAFGTGMCMVMVWELLVRFKFYRMY